jgi:hypothetical protein
MKTDKAISEEILKIDKDQAEYQRLYFKYYGEKDLTAKHIYDLLIKLCYSIRKEIDG